MDVGMLIPRLEGLNFGKLGMGTLKINDALPASDLEKAKALLNRMKAPMTDSQMEELRDELMTLVEKLNPGIKKKPVGLVRFADRRIEGVEKISHIAVNEKSGEIFISSAAKKNIEAFDPTGRLMRRIEAPENLKGEFKPTKFVFTKKGQHLVALGEAPQTSINIFRTMNGCLEKTNECSALKRPIGIAVNEKDDLIILDSSSDSGKIVILEFFGTPKNSFDLSAHIKKAAGVEYHDGSIYVADEQNMYIAAFSMDGTLKSCIGSHMSVLGIVGFCFTPDSKIVVTTDKQIVEFTLTGQVINYFTIDGDKPLKRAIRVEDGFLVQYDDSLPLEFFKMP